jgi:predicted Zn-ribbon and HTH transcriptional regulator
MSTRSKTKKIPFPPAGCKYCSYTAEMTLAGQKGPCPRCQNVNSNNSSSPMLDVVRDRQKASMIDNTKYNE